MSDVSTRLLRETLRGRMTPASSSGCIDTETLAAWSDGALSARERAAAESHASSCLRCQALLATMAQLETSETSETSSPPTPARGWWHGSTIGWLVPVAVAAAAVLLWINVPGGRLARSAAPPRAPSSVRAPSTRSAERPAESKDEALEPQRLARADEQRARPARGAAQSVVPRPEQANTVPGGARSAAVAPPPATPASPVADPSSRITAAEAQPTAAAEVPQAAGPKPLSRPRAMADQAMFGARAQVMAKGIAVPTIIFSPDANVRWRIVTAGGVERSIDGGVTWETQSTGVPATLTAGVAPSATICWLVGPGGLVVLSIDGKTWQRISFPETIDLASIVASDAANATVTAADGRTFTTVDGGKTWRANP